MYTYIVVVSFIGYYLNKIIADFLTYTLDTNQPVLDKYTPYRLPIKLLAKAISTKYLSRLIVISYDDEILHAHAYRPCADVRDMCWVPYENNDIFPIFPNIFTAYTT